MGCGTYSTGYFDEESEQHYLLRLAHENAISINHAHSGVTRSPFEEVTTTGKHDNLEQISGIPRRCFNFHDSRTGKKKCALRKKNARQAIGHPYDGTHPYAIIDAFNDFLRNCPVGNSSSENNFPDGNSPVGNFSVENNFSNGSMTVGNVPVENNFPDENFPAGNIPVENNFPDGNVLVGNIPVENNFPDGDFPVGNFPVGNLSLVTSLQQDTIDSDSQTGFKGTNDVSSSGQATDYSNFLLLPHGTEDSMNIWSGGTSSERSIIRTESNNDLSSYGSFRNLFHENNNLFNCPSPIVGYQQIFTAQSSGVYGDIGFDDVTVTVPRGLDDVTGRHGVDDVTGQHGLDDVTVKQLMSETEHIHFNNRPAAAAASCDVIDNHPDATQSAAPPGEYFLNTPMLSESNTEDLIGSKFTYASDTESTPWDSLCRYLRKEEGYD